jgi:hypothetical protein
MAMGIILIAAVAAVVVVYFLCANRPYTLDLATALYTDAS